MNETPTVPAPKHYPKRGEVLIHIIAPIDQGVTHLLCDSAHPIGAYRHTSHPDLYITEDDKMFSPLWRLTTCIQCDRKRISMRKDVIYQLIASVLASMGEATCSQFWQQLRLHPDAVHIGLSRGVLNNTLRDLVREGKLVYEDRRGPNNMQTMAYWYRLG